MRRQSDAYRILALLQWMAVSPAVDFDWRRSEVLMEGYRRQPAQGYLTTSSATSAFNSDTEKRVNLGLIDSVIDPVRVVHLN